MHVVLNTLTMFQEHLHHKVVHLICDNLVVVSAIHDGFSWSRELRTILCMLHLLLCDNFVVLSVICDGFSPSHKLHTILCTLHLLLLQLDLTLIPQWISSKSNAAADWLSRVNMSDNCRVRPAVIQALKHHFRPIYIDYFATVANAICQRFNSYFAELGCKAPDAFA